MSTEDIAAWNDPSWVLGEGGGVQFEYWGYTPADQHDDDGIINFNLELHHNYPQYLEVMRATRGAAEYGLGEWEISIDGTKFIRVPDTCTTMEERAAWAVAMWRLEGRAHAA